MNEVVVAQEDSQEKNRADAYSVLRRDIIELRLKPGTIVSIKDLCLHFQMSRSPMRDALLHLNEEGLVTLLPQRGTMIARIDLERAEEERFLRASVERGVMQLYMSHRSEEDVTRLESYIQQQEESIEVGDFRRFMQLDDDFHEVFYQATGKPFCSGLIRKVSGHYNRMRLLTCVDMGITKDVLQQHHDMVEAIKAGDAERLYSVFNHHLSKIDVEERGLLEKYPDLFLKNGREEREHDTLESDFLKTL